MTQREPVAVPSAVHVTQREPVALAVALAPGGALILPASLIAFAGAFALRGGAGLLVPLIALVFPLPRIAPPLVTSGLLRDPRALGRNRLRHLLHLVPDRLGLVPVPGLLRPRGSQSLQVQLQLSRADLEPHRVLVTAQPRRLVGPDLLHPARPRQRVHHIHRAGQGDHHRLPRPGRAVADGLPYVPDAEKSERPGLGRSLHRFHDEVRPAHRRDRVERPHFYLLPRLHQHPRHRSPNSPRHEVGHVANPFDPLLLAQFQAGELAHRHRGLASEQNARDPVPARLHYIAPVEIIPELELVGGHLCPGHGDRPGDGHHLAGGFSRFGGGHPGQQGSRHHAHHQN